MMAELPTTPNLGKTVNKMVKAVPYKNPKTPKPHTTKLKVEFLYSNVLMNDHTWAPLATLLGVATRSFLSPFSRAALADPSLLELLLAD
jgi:hypothetical protein